MSKEVVIDGVTYVPKIGNHERVIVRCRNAGVHVGTLVLRDAIVFRLERANRIWRWRGANTLSEVAVSGVTRDEYTRIAVEVPFVELTPLDVCEVIPVSNGIDLTEVWND